MRKSTSRPSRCSTDSSRTAPSSGRSTTRRQRNHDRRRLGLCGLGRRRGNDVIREGAGPEQVPECAECQRNSSSEAHAGTPRRTRPPAGQSGRERSLRLYCEAVPWTAVDRLLPGCSRMLQAPAPRPCLAPSSGLQARGLALVTTRGPGVRRAHGFGAGRLRLRERVRAVQCGEAPGSGASSEAPMCIEAGTVPHCDRCGDVGQGGS